MLFWVFLLIMSIFLVIIEKHVNYRFKRYFQLFFVVLLTFISGFRYQIGWDYTTYTYLFENINEDWIIIEPFTVVIINFLQLVGADYQALFLTYSILTFLFLWMGLKQYNKNNIMLSLFLFMSIPHLYWNSFSVIRFFLALAICFWGARFILTREFWKYALVIIIASNIHLSAILLLGCYWIVHKKFNRPYHFGAVFLAFLLAQTGVLALLIQNILAFSGKYAFYVESTAIGWTSILGMVVSLLPWLLVVWFKEKNNYNISENLAINMYTISMILVFIFSFSDTLHRTRILFSVFAIVVIPLMINNFRQRFVVTVIVLVFYSVLFISNIYSVQNYEAEGAFPMANNIEYEFNFKIFK